MYKNETELDAFSLLKEVVIKNYTNPIKRNIKRYLNKIRIVNLDISIESINLLHQSNNTIANTRKLLKNNEIVDSAALMRSCMEKIMMAMMIYLDPANTYQEFKNLEKCGRTSNTRPTNVLNNFKLKVRNINPFVFEDITDDEIDIFFQEMYDKLCLYTHSSIVVSMMIEVQKNNDEDLFIAFFYQMCDFLELLLYCCLKYLCNDGKEHIDLVCFSCNLMLYFNKIDKNKLKAEYIDKYKAFLHLDINDHFIDKYNDMIQKIKNDSVELQNEIYNNSDKINEYFSNLIIKNNNNNTQ